MNIITYHELRRISPEKAREVVRKVFEENNRNVSKTARILCISRHNVRRAINSPLHDKSRRPNNCPKKTPAELENLIILEAKRTGFRYRRLSLYLHRKYGLTISENTIKSILKRNAVGKNKRRTTKGEGYIM